MVGPKAGQAPRAEQAPPLRGVRVLDLTRLLPGAYATLLLADLGADVIKIEDPRGGDGMRRLPTSGANPYFDRLNRNKRSVTLDLRSSEAAAVLAALAAQSDVMVDSFRPSTARRLGVDAATLRARHPRLVCASISGFGQSGPYVEHAAHDINYQALAGLLMPRGSTLRQAQGSPRAEQSSLTLRSSAGEVRMPGPLVGDIGAAMQAAIGILAALLQRERTGQGGHVDVPIAQAALAWSLFPTTADLENACYTLYETADGQWLALGALEAKFWKGFCERLGRPDLIARQHPPPAERARVIDEVRAIMRSRTQAEWLAHFEGVDVCLTPVLTPDDVRVSSPGTAPALGAHTDDVLAAAGIGEHERARLRRLHVI